MQGKEDGGESGIRTHGPVAGTYAFQAYPIGHSGTSPQVSVSFKFVLAEYNALLPESLTS